MVASLKKIVEAYIIYNPSHVTSSLNNISIELVEIIDQLQISYLDFISEKSEINNIQNLLEIIYLKGYDKKLLNFINDYNNEVGQLKNSDNKRKIEKLILKLMVIEVKNILSIIEETKNITNSINNEDFKRHNLNTSLYKVTTIKNQIISEFIPISLKLEEEVFITLNNDLDKFNDFLDTLDDKYFDKKLYYELYLKFINICKIESEKKELKIFI